MSMFISETGRIHYEPFHAESVGWSQPDSTRVKLTRVRESSTCPFDSFEGVNMTTPVESSNDSLGVVIS